MSQQGFNKAGGESGQEYLDPRDCPHTHWTYRSRYQKICDWCHTKRYVEVAEWEEMLLFRRWQWKPVPTRPVWEQREERKDGQKEQKEQKDKHDG